jgi:hypothetical protein
MSVQPRGLKLNGMWANCNFEYQDELRVNFSKHKLLSTLFTITTLQSHVITHTNSYTQVLKVIHSILTILSYYFPIQYSSKQL